MATQEQVDARFSVINLTNGKYGVLDLINARRVGFSYSTPPLYREDEWHNWHSARGFCQKLFAKQETSE